MSAFWGSLLSGVCEQVHGMQVAGMALEALKQPVINGYFIAGSLVGPGGAGLIKVPPIPGLV